METLRDELALLFKGNSSYQLNGENNREYFRQNYKYVLPFEVIAYKINKGLFNKKTYVFVSTGAYINENFFSLLGCLSITKSGSDYLFDYGDGVNRYKIDKEVADYLIKMFEVRQRFERLGDAYAYGKGVKKDIEKAIYYYKETINKEADLGDNVFSACGWLAYKREKYLHAYSYALVGKAYKELDAIYLLGICHQYGLDMPMDKRKAIEIYEEGLKLDPNHSNMCRYKAWAHLDLKEYDLVYDTVSKARDTRNFERLVGLCYDYGYGIEANSYFAKTRYLQAIKNNDIYAYYNLALLSRYTGKEKDFYEYACEALNHNINDAHSLLGYAYQYGFGIYQDDKKAIEHYEKMISLSPNYYAPYYRLGYMYLHNKDIQDYKKAYEYFMKCYNDGDPSGNYELYFMYKNGLYVEKNKVKSENFLTEGFNAGEVDCMVEVANRAINTFDIQKTKKGYDILAEAIKKERCDNVAINSYINHLLAQDGIQTLSDLKEHFENIYKIYENRQLAIHKNFQELQHLYVEHIKTICKLTPSESNQEVSKRKAIYIYSGNRHHCFLGVHSLEVYELSKDKVSFGTGKIGELYTITFDKFGPCSAQKRLKVDELIDPTNE